MNGCIEVIVSTNVLIFRHMFVDFLAENGKHKYMPDTFIESFDNSENQLYLPATQI